MRYPVSFLILIIFFACSKNSSQPDPTARDITGSVQVFDEFGVASNDVFGVNVSLSDGSKELTTQTIQGGKFNFDQVPFGKYTLSVSRSGFGTNKRFGIQNLKTVDSATYPLQLSPIGITQMCSTTITYFSAIGKPNGSFQFSVSISPATGPSTTPRYFRIFVGLDSLVTWNHNDFFVSAIPVTGSGMSSTLSALQRETFPVGTKAWMRIYGDASPSNMYFDSSKMEFVFPCLNLTTQPASSFIVQ